MASKHGLGRGLGALIKDGTVPEGTPAETAPYLTVPVTAIRTNPLQPRRAFDADALEELANSIRERGVLQPLLVRKTVTGYELIAGERRLRAAQSVQVTEVPVIVMDAPDVEALELALVENLQREDLNVIEEAEGYQVLAERFGLTQEQIAGHVGKARASVANTVRLLSLPEEIRQHLSNGRLTSGHGKLLVGLEIPAEQLLLARRVIKEGLSVRNLEKIIQKAGRAPRRPRVTTDDIPASHIRDLSDKLHNHFGTSIRIRSCRTLTNGKKARGAIEIDFYSTDDLDRVLQLLGLPDEP